MIADPVAAPPPHDAARGVVLQVRLGLVHYATFPESLASAEAFGRTLRLAVTDAPWDVLELSTETPPEWTRAIRELVPPPVAIYVAAAPEMLRWPDSLNSASRQSRHRAVDRVLPLVDAAAEIGAENLMLTSGPVAGGADTPGPLLESFARICERAARTTPPLNISVETFATTAIQRQYVGPTTLALSLMETIRREYRGFGITLDIAHVLQLGEDLAESLALTRGQVRHLHLSSCVLQPGDPRWGDRHLPFGTRGAHPTHLEMSRGLACWASGFDGPDGDDASPPVVSMEIRPRAGEDSAVVHTRSQRALSRLCSMARLGRRSLCGEEQP